MCVSQMSYGRAGFDTQLFPKVLFSVAEKIFNKPMEVIVKSSKEVMITSLQKLLEEWKKRCVSLSESEDKNQLSESIQILSAFIKTLEQK
jgi:hypothetical protein